MTGPNHSCIRKLNLTIRRIALKSIILVIDAFVSIGKLFRRGIWPLYRLARKTIKKIFLGTILNSYFLVLKLQRKIKSLAQSSNHTILSWLNRYLYKATLVIIVLLTLAHNLWATSLNAEELSSQIPLNTISSENDETAVQLIQEGPLNEANQATKVSYLDTDTVMSDNPLEAPAPDTDDDIMYSPEDDQPIIAPVITDTHGTSGTNRSKIETYVVQAGDTIGTIAQKFDLSINTILWANGLTGSSTIKPGQSITILPTSGVSHTVKNGETVTQIAKKYQVDPATIIEGNKLASAADIQVGEVLIIPNGINPTTVIPRPRQQQSLGSIIQDILVPGQAGISQELGGKFLWPVLSRRITQYFKLRHTGVDIGDKIGNPIYAAENGRVERAGWNNGGYGNYVIINHGNGIQTLYGHQSKILVKAGDTVARGQQIGMIGSTGRSTGPHLHFEVRINGRVTNPLNYIR